MPAHTMIDLFNVMKFIFFLLIGIGIILLVILILKFLVFPFLLNMGKIVSEGPSIDDENCSAIQKWYNNMSENQRLFLYILSILTIPFFGVGIITLCILIYCKLGMKKL